MKKEKLKKLKSNQAKKVSGGYIYYNEEAIPKVCNCISQQHVHSEEIPAKPWEVRQDSTYRVLKSFATKDEAINFANQELQSTDIINN